MLRKTKFLKGSNIYVGEDFSKRVKDQRQELRKFMRHMKQRRPSVKCRLQYDKLLVDKDVYMFNDLTGYVELVNQDGMTLNLVSPGVVAAHAHASTGQPGDTDSRPPSRNVSATNYRKKSSGRRKLHKSYSTESSLNHIVPNTPLYAPDSPQKHAPGSPRKHPASPNKSNGNGRANGSSTGNGNGDTSLPEPPSKPKTPEPPKEEPRAVQAEVDRPKEPEPNNEAPAKTNGDDHKIDSEEICSNPADQDVVEYQDISAYSPIKRGNPIIPETIPE